jgi:hypothetical protein
MDLMRIGDRVLCVGRPHDLGNVGADGCLAAFAVRLTLVGRRDLHHVLDEQLCLLTENFLAALSRVGRERVKRSAERPVVDLEVYLHPAEAVSMAAGHSRKCAVRHQTLTTDG